MEKYAIPLVPGPTSVPLSVREAYLADYGSGDLELEFVDLYQETARALGQILGTDNQMVIGSGEGMLALWSALKSCLLPGDRVLAVATGVFGYGIADMARSVGAQVEVVGFEYDEVAQPEVVAEAIRRFQPKMVTAVHCETPSGTLNPVGEIGTLVREHDVPLYYVDYVASAAGAEVQVDKWNIDLGLLGTQKALSCLPDLSIVTVSERAWAIVEEVGYVGYDALAPWRTAVQSQYFPHTPNWQAMAALHHACERVLSEGLPQVLQRHAEVATYCRQRVQGMGLELFPRSEAACAPTVTAVRVPEALSWAQLDRRLRERGMVVGGSYGPLAGQVFRIGHMGYQAEMSLVRHGMDVLQSVL